VFLYSSINGEVVNEIHPGQKVMLLREFDKEWAREHYGKGHWIQVYFEGYSGFTVNGDWQPVLDPIAEPLDLSELPIPIGDDFEKYHDLLIADGLTLNSKDGYLCNGKKEDCAENDGHIIVTNEFKLASYEIVKILDHLRPILGVPESIIITQDSLWSDTTSITLVAPDKLKRTWSSDLTLKRSPGGKVNKVDYFYRQEGGGYGSSIELISGGASVKYWTISD
jgi:hypothetical protein